MLAKIIYIFSVIFLFSKNIYSQQKDIEFRGYIKDLQTFSFTDNIDTVTTGAIIHNRLNFKFYPLKNTTAGIEIRNRLFYGEIVKETPGFAQTLDDDKGLIDLSFVPVNTHSVILHSIIDRLWVNYKIGNFNIEIGRQRINWGINNTWNPNDIFNTYNFLDFDYEEKPGVDALRLQYYTGLFSNFEFAVKPGKENDESISALRYSFNKWNYDLHFLGGIYLKDIVAGAGWAGNLKDAGFKGEVSYFIPKKDTEEEAVTSISASVDYAFKSGVYFNVSYLYNSSGKNDINQFIFLSNESLTPKNLMPAKNSFLLQGSYSFNPIVYGALSVIYSPAVNTVIVFPTLSYSIANDFDLELIAQSLWGDSNEHFKTIGNSIFIRIRWSY